MTYTEFGNLDMQLPKAVNNIPSQSLLFPLLSGSKHIGLMYGKPMSKGFGKMIKATSQTTKSQSVNQF